MRGAGRARAPPRARAPARSAPRGGRARARSRAIFFGGRNLVRGALGILQAAADARLQLDPSTSPGACRQIREVCDAGSSSDPGQSDSSRRSAQSDPYPTLSDQVDFRPATTSGQCCFSRSSSGPSWRSRRSQSSPSGLGHAKTVRRPALRAGTLADDARRPDRNARSEPFGPRGGRARGRARWRFLRTIEPIGAFFGRPERRPQPTPRASPRAASRGRGAASGNAGREGWRHGPSRQTLRAQEWRAAAGASSSGPCSGGGNAGRESSAHRAAGRRAAAADLRTRRPGPLTRPRPAGARCRGRVRAPLGDALCAASLPTAKCPPQHMNARSDRMRETAAMGCGTRGARWRGSGAGWGARARAAELTHAAARLASIPAFSLPLPAAARRMAATTRSLPMRASRTPPPPQIRPFCRCGDEP